MSASALLGAKDSRVAVGILLFAVVVAAWLWPLAWFGLMLIATVIVFIETALVHGSVTNVAPHMKAWLWLERFIVLGGLLCGSSLLMWIDPHGKEWIATIAISVFACDTFAYLTGKLLGRHKFFPSVSPKKTIEGTLGGVIFGTIFGTFVGWLWFQNTVAIAWLISVAFIAAVLTVIGDLVESKVKRLYGIKDFGTWLRGHGGATDRVDGLSLAYLGCCLLVAAFHI